MPIYEFKCGECGKEFSDIRRVGDDQGVSCPDCRSINTKKLISTFASFSTGSSPGCASAPSCSYAGGGG